MINTIAILQSIEDTVYSDFNVHCRPYGNKYIEMVLAMANKIIKEVDIKELTPEVEETLTEENFHMLTHAIDIIKHLDKYSLREYIS